MFNKFKIWQFLILQEILSPVMEYVINIITALPHRNQVLVKVPVTGMMKPAIC